MDRVEPLRKIHLSISAAETLRVEGTSHAGMELAFICGIGRSGITPFEARLAGKGVGDVVDLEVMTPQVERFFEHLAPQFCPAFTGRDAVHMRVKITRIETPAARDIVKAMAELSAHGGSGCDCGCGCG